jgi:hypothetical protein
MKTGMTGPCAERKSSRGYSSTSTGNAAPSGTRNLRNSSDTPAGKARNAIWIMSPGGFKEDFALLSGEHADLIFDRFLEFEHLRSLEIAPIAWMLRAPPPKGPKQSSHSVETCRGGGRPFRVLKEFSGSNRRHPAIGERLQKIALHIAVGFHVRITAVCLGS